MHPYVCLFCGRVSGVWRGNPEYYESGHLGLLHSPVSCISFDRSQQELGFLFHDNDDDHDDSNDLDDLLILKPVLSSTGPGFHDSTGSWNP